MRLSLRFVVPLLLALGLLGYAVVPLVDRLILGWFVRDLDARATLVSNTARERVLLRRLAVFVDGFSLEAAEGVFLSIMAATPLEHPEHAAIWLEPGAYRVVTQREYAPQEIVRVRD